MKMAYSSLVSYAESHGGSFPPSLMSLSPALPSAQLTCPDNNSSGPPVPYVYTGANLRLGMAGANSVLLYEPITAHGGTGVNVLYGDGHVTFVPAAQATSLIANIARASPSSATASASPSVNAPAVPETGLLPSPATRPARPPRTGTTIDLLAGAKFVNAGKGTSWYSGSDGIHGGGDTNQLLPLATYFADEYDLTAQFTRTSGDGPVVILLRSPARSFTLLSIGGWHNSVIGLDQAGPYRADTAPESVHGENLLSNGQEVSVVVHVRQDGVDAVVDDKYTLHAPANFKAWHVPDEWADLARPVRSFAIGAAPGTKVIFTKVQLVPIRKKPGGKPPAANPAS